MSDSRSSVRHHPLIQEDSPGVSPIGSPTRGRSPDRLLLPPDLDMEVFTSPHDPALNLLEVPNTNWTRGGAGGSNSMRVGGSNSMGAGSNSSSLASSTCDLSANLFTQDNKGSSGVSNK
ncbi:hypothetical protein Pmani_022438 [Petrolisthes manimaculis]|uniref:Uncharacterized protein n=1 Tax=Petrolisthes manimaculis TaxID=1843537 RepID=A0AAE1U0N2_9EUCA|nr:hypothetical protein Pmani_022438 [Petrolisthes manimaculis]